MLAEQLDVTLESLGSQGDILPSNYDKVKTFCLDAKRGTPRASPKRRNRHLPAVSGPSVSIREPSRENSTEWNAARSPAPRMVCGRATASSAGPNSWTPQGAASAGVGASKLGTICQRIRR
jgi:hypothetical protein